MVVDALKNVSASHRSPQDMENHYECLGTGAVHIALTAPPGCGRGRPLASVTVTIDAPDCCPWRGFIVESTCGTDWAGECVLRHTRLEYNWRKRKKRFHLGRNLDRTLSFQETRAEKDIVHLRVTIKFNFQFFIFRFIRNIKIPVLKGVLRKSASTNVSIAMVHKSLKKSP